MDVVMKLLIDDGVPNRAHRNSIFEPKFTVFGCYSSHHIQLRNISVLSYAAGFLNNENVDKVIAQEKE